ncbi:peptide chain release factor 3 [Propylenella binzhouense]|uniref:Peptide chain release factor 3 n=1 Tax=Propylenella binzhouense TaxID=2555902 RepID=A0A964WV56_9HYPH|nr:peptide chain release factor 3 [Propylenella binzhouense]MYZ49867.1 peptide chain release factor 3 [Propylenella binzhouense]
MSETAVRSQAGEAAPAPSGGAADILDPRTRRSFAIISHPDAGKTTLTEKLLLAGGAIRLAGAVRARGEQRRTRSDWMAIERERGISVSSTVMRFERGGLAFNLLDTPGHEDFSEDTYRTLTAVDSAVMVIDAAKGIEAQTRKLFEVCRLRDIPIVTFVNKIDREGRHPFELLDEIESTLALDAAPVAWPVGMGTDFHGVFDLVGNRFLTSSHGRGGAFDTLVETDGPDDPKLEAYVSAPILAEFRDQVALAQEGYARFDRAAFREGHLTPVVFGSALRDYSIDGLLDLIAAEAPSPRPQPSDAGEVAPGDDAVTGFVFKVQANMDPNHRDRIAFVRLCSGRFRRGMKLNHVRSGKPITVHSPVIFFAQERQIAEQAVAGDVIGIPNHGTLRVGDTLSEREAIRFTGLPAFAPEVLRRVLAGDSSKVKQIRQALEDLAEEGLVQVFRPALGSQWIVGVVGILQLDVLKSRVQGEYGATIELETAPFVTARWIGSDDPKALEEFRRENMSAIAEDRDGRPVYLARSQWELDNNQKRYPAVRFSDTCELTY